MKKLIGLVVFLAMTTPVFAQEEKNAVTIAKDVVEYLDPSVDTLYILKNSDITEGEMLYGLSAVLYRQTDNEEEIGSIKMGYVPINDNRWYSSVNANLKGIVKNYAPDALRPAEEGLYSSTLAFAEKYGTFGFALGYDWDNSDMFWGPTVGVKITF